jgi:hypothetical protein
MAAPVSYVESPFERIISINWPSNPFSMVVFGSTGSQDVNTDQISLQVGGGLGVYSGLVTFEPPLPTPPGVNGYFRDVNDSGSRSKKELFGAKFKSQPGVPDTIVIKCDYKGGLGGGKPIGYSAFAGAFVYHNLSKDFNVPQGDDPNFLQVLQHRPELIGGALSPVVQQAFVLGDPNFGLIQELIGTIKFPITGSSNQSASVSWSVGAFQ